MSYQMIKTSLEGLVVIKSDIYRDDRGYFMENFKKSAFVTLGLPEFKQDNVSFSKKGVLRGLHYQLPPNSQGKLVRVIEGKIWDVAVDIRKNSPTFGKWEGKELVQDSEEAFYLPPGFAHGFVVLSDFARVLYKTSSEYDPKAERGIVWNDADLKIEWPVENPILAERDAAFPKFKDAEIL